MPSHFQSLTQDSLYSDAFRVAPPAPLPGRDIVPRRPAAFIRKTTGADPAPAGLEAQTPGRELLIGQFGLVPAWVKSASDAKLRSVKLVNARSETLTTSTPYRDAWLASQRCIVPMMAFFEDDLRSGKPIPTRIARVDGKPLGVAGLWERWTGAEGEEIISFTLLTVNANSHALMRRYQHEGTEKRMPVILNEGSYDAWLNTTPEKARDFMRAYPAQSLLANPVEGKKNK
ncbi:MAG: SOS response-associated peptidase [Curvibacter sp.]|nr:MAG: SOS response-associated peptidase [Curvibacter sp.]